MCVLMWFKNSDNIFIKHPSICRTSADSATLHNQFVTDITIGSWCPAGWDYDASTAYIQVIIKEGHLPVMQ